ncbi:CBS DOMAIN-CONTAINING PROTEIN CBSX5-LIKE [Salix purpurea]|uniref:CBS DOMAIN-CONTAINING PROTEIN CBSX5-LIKE n=1 Tax=Salix purpurea TaxID=77065 RepID=A0A9Q0WH22_SALPP|nr:CBS DOMAIN-CONTAINING PROTEIN CBSX5-LIKE [Salix purpurea]
MAFSILTNEVSDLCLGKPALSSLSLSATVGEALSALKRSGDLFLSVWSCDQHHRCNSPRSIKDNFAECKCIGKVCLVDVICFLSKEENLKNPGRALQEPVSLLLNSKVSGLVRHLEPHLTRGYKSHPRRCTESCDTASQPLHEKEADKQIHRQFHPPQQP